MLASNGQTGARVSKGDKYAGFKGSSYMLDGSPRQSSASMLGTLTTSRAAYDTNEIATTNYDLDLAEIEREPYMSTVNSADQTAFGASRLWRRERTSCGDSFAYLSRRTTIQDLLLPQIMGWSRVCQPAKGRTRRDAQEAGLKKFNWPSCQLVLPRGQWIVVKSHDKSRGIVQDVNQH